MLGVLVVIVGGYYGACYLGLLGGGTFSISKETSPVLFDNKNRTDDKGIRIEKVAENLYVPWSIVFLDESNLLFTERNGAIRQIQNGRLVDLPSYRFDDVSTDSEEGLMGMALDPDYQSNNYLYVCLAYSSGSDMYDKVIRLTYKKNQIEEDKIILDKIPAAKFHAGCKLKFGPDKKLYITTGDATDKNIAQDRNSLGGKILRINSDGSIPSDNPFSKSPIYSYGHRNPQGLDWDELSGHLFATEHGPSLFDGPAGGDEINYVKKGENYGWPLVSHEKTKEGLVSPIAIFTPAIAPSAGIFYTGDLLTQFKNHFLVAMLKGEGILDVQLGKDRDSVASYEKIPEITYGRIREIVESPDGYIYFSTSNKDGRGKPADKDDAIYKISPQYD